MKYLMFLRAFLAITVTQAQPDLTLWRVFEEAHDHDSDAGHHTPPELYERGAYYFFVSDDKAESLWSIKNEGDQNLTIDLPLVFDPSPATSMRISGQPDKAILAPGEETIFKIEYDFYSVHGDVYLDIQSDDPDGDYGLLVGGNFATCTCICTNSGTTNIGTCIKGDGDIGGVPISTGPPCAENQTCAPISVTDPCDCDNTITAAGQFLYRDTLRVQTTPSTLLTLTRNSGGFVDENNMNIAPGAPLGTSDPSTGILEYVFYRPPSTMVDISVNGLNFTSPACPAASACTATPPAVVEDIPTLSEWSIIILSFMLLIISVIAIKQSYSLKEGQL